MTLGTRIRRAIIKMELASPKLANTVFQALKPEVHISQKLESKIQIKVEDSVLILFFEAQSTSRLRAIINSYLRWVITAINTIEVGGPETKASE